MPRAKQRTRELKDRVVDVAVATLAREGVAGFTTRTVAREANTSTPAVYELFGDKAGLVRAVFFEGFRTLGRVLGRLETSDDPRADLVRTIQAIRGFVRDNAELGELMFSRPFAEFDPSPEERRAGAAVREHIVDGVRRCVAHGHLAGDETDIGHVLLAVVQGLAAQEHAGWLGTSRASIERRWTLAVHAVLDGLAPGSPAR